MIKYLLGILGLSFCGHGLSQDTILFLGDSCYVFEKGIYQRKDGGWIEFDNRKDYLLKLIADSTVQILDSEIADYFYDEFDNCIRRYFIKNNEYHGTYSIFYPDTILQEQGEYNEGSKIGVWKRYNKEEVLLEEKFYDNRSGLVERIEYEENGGGIHIHLAFFKTDSGIEQVEIKSGNVSIDLYPNDQMKERVIIWPHQNKRSIERWYPNGNVQYRGIEIKKDGQYHRHGEWLEYNEVGGRLAKKYYNQGKKIGFWTLYDSDERLDRYESYSKTGKFRGHVKLLLPERDGVEHFTELHYDRKGNYKKKFVMNF